jgi:hypothetical protein
MADISLARMRRRPNPRQDKCPRFETDFLARAVQAVSMKVLQPGAHIDHMLRQTRVHHVQLSSMADIKANMLLTLAAVMVTIAAPHVMKPALRWPAAVLILSCLATVVLAIYAVMPKLPLRVPAERPSRTAAFNLLFFGDFVQMTSEEFEGEMEKVLNDASEVYRVQVREIYTLGVFLAQKKYRFLKLAYLTFLFGLLASAATLVVMEIFV